MNRRSSLIVLMLVHASLNSGGFLMVKLGLTEFGSFAFAFWRFLFGLAGLATVIRLLRAWPKIEREDWPRVVFLAIVSLAGNQVFYLVGMRYTVPSHASLIYGSTVVAAIVLSTLLGYERLRKLKVAAIVMALAGLVLVITDSPTPIIGTEGAHGDLLLIVSMLAWAVYTVMAKPLVAKYGAVPTSMICLTLGSLIVLPFMIPAALAQDYSVLTWRGWAGTLYAGIMVTTLSHTLWFAMLKRIDPSQVAILSTPQPVITTLLSVLLLGEALTLALISGGLLVISGVVLMQLPALLPAWFAYSPTHRKLQYERKAD